MRMRAFRVLDFCVVVAFAALLTLAKPAVANSGNGAPRSASPETVAATTIGPDEFQVFIRPWRHETKAFCAVIESDQQWRQLLLPAAVAFGNKPFAPEPTWWRTHAVLLVARSTYSSTNNVFRLQSIHRTPHGLAVNYAFAPPREASSTMPAWIGFAVAKPIAFPVTFAENGKNVCVLHASGVDGRSRPAA